MDTERIGPFEVRTYTNKRQEERISISGPTDAMKRAGLLGKEYKTETYTGGTIVRLLSGDADAVLDRLRAEQPETPTTMRGWFAVADRKEVRRLLHMIEEWNERHTVNRSHVADLFSSRNEAFFVHGLMLRDGWLDAMGRLTEHARKEVPVWTDMLSQE